MSFFGTSDPINNYRMAFPQRWREDTPVAGVRFVVLDTETTGLNPRQDLIVSVGAVAVNDGEIDLQDQFEALLKVSYNSSSVVVHGVTREASQKGLEEAEGLRMLLNYLRDAVIVGHHVAFDIDILLNRCHRRFGIDLSNQWLDTGTLVNSLDAVQALPPDSGENVRQDASLDGVCGRLGIPLHDRHTAAGDAFICAQLFLKLLHYAQRCGCHTLGALLSLAACQT